MKILGIISKSLKEQIRSYWVLLLTLSMGPFFIFIYYLITETSKPRYDVVLINNDQGWVQDSIPTNHGKELIGYFKSFESSETTIPFTSQAGFSRDSCIQRLKNKDADALIIIPPDFTESIEKTNRVTIEKPSQVEFIGDLTNANYLISAVWANEILNRYILQATHQRQPAEVKETGLGVTASVSDFEMMVPGLLIVSLIMLMFTASIAFVSEVENKTILRLKLSKLTALEFLGGIGFVQLLVGIVSVLLTLATALMLGFQFSGSLLIMIFIAGLASLSLISFSLIIAAATRSANEVLVVGNFPMFLFMFFTGAAFPLKSQAWFTIAGYPVNLQGLMTPTHAISALNKTLMMGMGFHEIVPEIIAILFLTLIYFVAGALLFRKRHLKLM